MIGVHCPYKLSSRPLNVVLRTFYGVNLEDIKCRLLYDLRISRFLFKRFYLIVITR